MLYIRLQCKNTLQGECVYALEYISLLSCTFHSHMLSPRALL